MVRIIAHNTRTDTVHLVNRGTFLQRMEGSPGKRKRYGGPRRTACGLAVLPDYIELHKGSAAEVTCPACNGRDWYSRDRGGGE